MVWSRNWQRNQTQFVEKERGECLAMCRMKVLCLRIWPRGVSFRSQKLDGVWKWGPLKSLASKREETHSCLRSQPTNYHLWHIIKILNISFTKIYTSYPGVQFYWQSSLAQLLYTSVSLFALLTYNAAIHSTLQPITWKWERLTNSSNIPVPSPIWVGRSWSFCRMGSPLSKEYCPVGGHIKY